MELRVLKYFLMVAREESITKAANLLHITQPTLSRQLMQLEEELGVKLFIRNKKHILLTEEGMLLRRRAEEIVTLSEKTREELSHSKEDLSGKINIGSGELRTSLFLAELIISFKKLHPLVEFEIYSGNADNIKERIESGILDIGLLQEPVDISKYDFMRTPFKEHWGLLINEDSPLAKKETISPSDIKGLPLILPQRTLVKNEFTSWLGEYADEASFILTGNLLYNLAMVAKAGNVGVITPILECNYPELKYIPLHPEVTSGTVLAWKKIQVFSPAVSAFLDYSRSYISGMNTD